MNNYILSERVKILAPLVTGAIGILFVLLSIFLPLDAVKQAQIFELGRSLIFGGGLATGLTGKTSDKIDKAGE